jgi:uncharacterized membrane protein
MRRMKVVLGLWGLLWMASVAQGQQAVATIELPGGKTAQVTFTTVDVPGAVVTSVQGINTAGVMVGLYGTSNNGPVHGFSSSGGTITIFDYPSAETTVARGINDFGTIVGYAEFSGGLIVRGFLYDMQSFTTVDVPGVAETYPDGINNAGQLVGRAGPSGNLYGAFEMNGNEFILFHWPGQYDNKAASGINNFGEVSGFLTNGTTADKGLAYKGGKFKAIAFPGAQISSAWGINDSGTIVGWYQIGTTVNGFAWTGGQYISLAYPGAKGTFARGINNSGQVVGEYTFDFIAYHGFVTSPLVLSAVH